MGEAKSNPCKTVALRYRFIFKDIPNGTPILRFQPHRLIKLEYPIPPSDTVEEEVLKAENVVYEDDVEYLRSLDPKEWKSQDHYKVLGIPTLRIRATDEIIKTAYRKKVLKHHPDKRKALGEEIREDDDYFTCITMAYETLGNPQRRKAYDSVDPEFDNSIPTNSDLKKDFFEVFQYYFDLNSRWSERKCVKLGGPDSTREQVERFYSFWYDFKSWREYSYEDEEDKEKCTDRDERRYVDKLNKAERLRKKKEEMSRIRSLVDLAYSNDPRIAKFKQEDKDRKLASKRAKQTAAQQKRDEEERLKREADLAKQQAEEAERARIEAKRQEREIQKKALKKERKALRDWCKTNNYYAENGEENLRHLTQIETICETYSLQELEEVNKKIKSGGKSSFLAVLKQLNSKIEKEKQESLNQDKKHDKSVKIDTPVKTVAEWNEHNINLLVKAVNLFPAGTNQRWEVVANFINQHGQFKVENAKFNAKNVLAKAKDLQNTDFSKNNLKETANKQAFENFKQSKKNVVTMDESDISRKMDGIQINGESENKKAPQQEDKKLVNGDANNKQQQNGKSEKELLPWTTAEQQLLEQALKTYPASTAERWDRIAECIPNRTKKECMKRYKELVETVRAKRAAQASVATTVK